MMNGYMYTQLCLICIRIVWIYATYVVNDVHVQYVIVICDDDNDVIIMMTIPIMPNECIMNDHVSCIMRYLHVHVCRPTCIDTYIYMYICILYGIIIIYYIMIPISYSNRNLLTLLYIQFDSQYNLILLI